MAEKAHGVTVSIFGIGLAIIQVILACFIIYFAINFNIMISGITTPAYDMVMSSPGYLVGLLNATSALLLIGGIYVLIHAIKRIIDYAFKTYIASRQQA